MPRISYVNGRFCRHAESAVHIEDRGFQFSDGIYEVWAVMNGRRVDVAGHNARLQRSLSELAIRLPMSIKALDLVLQEVLRRNRVQEGLLYLQVTRGVAPRDHAFPTLTTPPSIIITAKPINRVVSEQRAMAGIQVITCPDNRWGRCDIKSVGLLPNVLAKQAARASSAQEAWFVDSNGYVTEGASSNAWILDRDGRLRTRDLKANILPGVTRSTLLSVIQEQGWTVNDSPFSVADAKAAKEAFITGAGALVMPVVGIDNAPVGDGRPGQVALRLRTLYLEAVKRSSS